MEMFNKFIRGIKIVRVIKEMSQAELAEAAGIKASTYNRFEIDSRQANPRLETLVGLSNAVGMTIEEVLQFVDELDERFKK